MLKITLTVDEIDYKRAIDALFPALRSLAEASGLDNSLTRAFKKGDGGAGAAKLALTFLPERKRDAFVAEAADACAGDIAEILTRAANRKGAPLEIKAIEIKAED